MEFIWKIIFIVLLVAIAVTIANLVDKARRKKIGMSFRESVDLCELPIVTFINNGKKINFLLDTGASLSIIDKNTLKDLSYTDSNKVGDIYGFEGNKVSTTYINMSFYYKDKTYEDEFQVLDMSAPFGNLKSDFGVNVHGVLSSSFFQKYKYVLDFQELIAYSKI